MKTFVVEMDEKIHCEFCAGIISLQRTCAKEGSSFKKCKGDLDKRPSWCPLKEVTVKQETYIERLVDNEIELAEKHLCEMNAMEIRRLACALQLEADKCRKAYEK